MHLEDDLMPAHDMAMVPGAAASSGPAGASSPAHMGRVGPDVPLGLSPQAAAAAGLTASSVLGRDPATVWPVGAAARAAGQTPRLGRAAGAQQGQGLPLCYSPIIDAKKGLLDGAAAAVRPLASAGPAFMPAGLAASTALPAPGHCSSSAGQVGLGVAEAGVLPQSYTSPRAQSFSSALEEMYASHSKMHRAPDAPCSAAGASCSLGSLPPPPLLP